MISKYTIIAKSPTKSGSIEFLLHIEKICKEFKQNRIRHAILYFNPKFTIALQNYSPYLQSDEESKFLACLKMRFLPSKFQTFTRDFTLYIDTYEALPKFKAFYNSDTVSFTIKKNRKNVYKMPILYKEQNFDATYLLGIDPIGYGNIPSAETLNKLSNYTIHPTYGVLELNIIKEAYWDYLDFSNAIKNAKGKVIYDGLELSSCKVPKQMINSKNKNKKIRMAKYEVLNIPNAKYTSLVLVNKDFSIPFEKIESSFLHLF